MALLALGNDEDGAPSACRRGPNDDGGKVPERKNMTGSAAMQCIEASGPVRHGSPVNLHEMQQRMREAQSMLSSWGSL